MSNESKIDLSKESIIDLLQSMDDESFEKISQEVLKLHIIGKHQDPKFDLHLVKIPTKKFKIFKHKLFLIPEYPNKTLLALLRDYRSKATDTEMMKGYHASICVSINSKEGSNLFKGWFECWSPHINDKGELEFSITFDRNGMCGEVKTDTIDRYDLKRSELDFVGEDVLCDFSFIW